MDKKEYIKKRHSKRAPQSTRSIQKMPKSSTKNGEQQKTAPPQIEPNQSTKSTME